MKTSLICAALICAGLAAPAASARDAALAVPIHKMMEGFNKGDVAMVKAVHVAAPTIVDNVPPFLWSGPQSFDHWLSDLSKSEAKEGKTDGVVWFGESVDEAVSGNHAYLVAPARYTFKQNGHAMRETGMVAFVLAKEGGAWKVQAWSWASPHAVPVK